MEFTKEEIETAESLWDDYYSSEFCGKLYFKDWLNKKRIQIKKVILEIEYEHAYNMQTPMRKEFIFSAINNWDSIKSFKNIKVTELPEVFTREDMEDFARYRNYLVGKTEELFNKWLSERKSK